MDIRSLQRQLKQADAEARRAAAEVEGERRSRTAALAAAAESISDLKRRIDATAVRPHSAFATVASGGSLRPVGPAALRDRLRIVVALGAQQRHHWDARISAANSRRLRAENTARDIAQLMRRAKRFSPIDGVVTSIRAGEGDWVTGAVPVVRVDDPKGYQVVMLLRDRVGRTPTAGAKLQVRTDAGVTECRVAQTLKGWDRELFSTWVWLAPSEPETLAPGRQVEVLIPRASEHAAETASHTSTGTSGK
jgi:hypothetical protein